MGHGENGEILIAVKDLTLKYGAGKNSILALENIDLTINRSDFLCVLGPSGCGKSTLLKVIAGYVQPTGGSCLMQGEPIEGPDRHRGVVFQSSTLYPWMSVKENVEFGPRMRGLPEEEINEIRSHFLEQVNLSGSEEQYTFELSGGMKQRVALARVLANNPQVILMDEPFGALDALTRGKMQTLIRKVWKENNTTIFFITHDVNEALALGTKIVVLSQRPAKVLQKFDVDFTNEIYKSGSRDVMYNDEYVKIKKEILDLIYGQIED